MDYIIVLLFIILMIFFNYNIKNDLISILTNITSDKNGGEIIYLSKITVNPIYRNSKLVYRNAKTMDNIIFLNENKNYDYNRFEEKKGFVINYSKNIQDSSYDFLFAPHVLEHVINPISFLHDLLRIIKNSGYLILILSDETKYFDKKKISKFSDLIDPSNSQDYYVYNLELLMEITNYLNCKFIYTVTNGIDIWFIMQK